MKISVFNGRCLRPWIAVFLMGCVFPSLSVAQQQQSPEQRAKAIEQQMTDKERFQLLISLVGYVPTLGIPKDPRIPDDISMSAGYTEGIPRLNIPNIQSTDASMGVTNPGYRPDDPGATAMPASILVGSTFEPQLAYLAGRAIGKEARIRGFNVLLAGGINLIRDPRNGRNYEYYSEDPLSSGLFGAAAVNGIQEQQVISTLKHYSLNSNETNRHWLNAVIDPSAHMESDLLAFKIAIEKSNPGSIMGGYNKINGEYASGNTYLLQDLLRGQWGYKGYVMSDWGAVPHWDYALKGLDQESGIQLDVMQWGAEAFTDSLERAYHAGKFPKKRLSEMVQRILYALYSVGADQWNQPIEVDMKAHHALALDIARKGMVLLKNEGVLPLDPSKKQRIGVIGGFAQLGILCGTGSGAVKPVGGFAGSINLGGTGIMGGGRTLYLLPNSPLAALREQFPEAEIDFDPGYTVAEAKLLAKRTDLVIIFGSRVEGEGFDLPDLSLPWGQDQLIQEVAEVNNNCIVVLQTGNPVSMPWEQNVKAILQAWFPGQAGGTAIAEILSGKVNPSGKLPVSFPSDLSDHPRPTIKELGTPWGTPTELIYHEGAQVGYRWYSKQGKELKYPFGFGLSYTNFSMDELKITKGKKIIASFNVTNTGNRKGAEVTQLYLLAQDKTAKKRLLGFQRVELEAGETKQIVLEIDQRLIADYHWDKQRWEIKSGNMTFGLGNNSQRMFDQESLHFKKAHFK